MLVYVKFLFLFNEGDGEFQNVIKLLKTFRKKKNSIHEAACYPVIRILPFLDHFVTNHTTKKKKKIKSKFYLLGGIIHHYSYGIKIQLYLFRFAQFSSC